MRLCIDSHPWGRPRLFWATLVAAAMLICLWGASSASAGPTSVKTVYAPGRLVPIPASVPHEDGDMVDSRLVPDLRWLAAHFPIYITDGYSGPLPDGSHAGCNRCHVNNSDHYNGLAVDIVPLHWSAHCDANWTAITRLAKWAEPQQNQPVAPFRWVGYDGDAGHGCGNHLHLSWNHAPARPYTLADWVEVFPAGSESTRPSRKSNPQPPKPQPSRRKSPPGPTGGFGISYPGGVSPTGD